MSLNLLKFRINFPIAPAQKNIESIISDRKDKHEE